MKTLMLIAACGLLAAPAVASAQPVKSTVNARHAGDSRDSVVTRRDGKVCKSVLMTGSRLGAQPVCKTQKQWDDYAASFRATVERSQTYGIKFIERDQRVASMRQ